MGVSRSRWIDRNRSLDAYRSRPLGKTSVLDWFVRFLGGEWLPPTCSATARAGPSESEFSNGLTSIFEFFEFLGVELLGI